MKVDWTAMKQEYITDETSSYRKLAAKYGVSQTAICVRAKEEGWLRAREDFFNKTLAETLTAVSKAQAKRASRLQTIADKLLDKIDKAVDAFEMQDLMSDRQALRQITAALKDVKDIQMIKSDSDIREQEARIRSLEKQAAKDDEIKELKVTFESAGPEEWNE